MLPPVERGIEDADGDTGLPSVEEGELPEPVPEIVRVMFRVNVSTTVRVVMPGTVKVVVPVLVETEVMIVEGPVGEMIVELEGESAGDPSVEEGPTIGGVVIAKVSVVSVVTVVTFPPTGKLLETPVGPGMLDVLLLPVTGATGLEAGAVPVPDIVW